MLRSLANTTIADVERRNPARIAKTQTVGSAVRQMRELRRGSCIVCDDDGKPLGIFTQHDLVMRVDLNSPGWGDRLVAEIMTRDPACIRADKSLADALAAMDQNRCRSLPVLDADGAVEGVVSIRDVLSHVAEHFPQEFLNLPPEPTMEPNRRYGG